MPLELSIDILSLHKMNGLGAQRTQDRFVIPHTRRGACMGDVVAVIEAEQLTAAIALPRQEVPLAALRERAVGADSILLHVCFARGYRCSFRLRGGS
jgi:hypothetical protein